ncbi:hypothetical protein MED121_20726 [Marinomonas sp. MED121]|uniref:DUF1428 domain-containing protein n=1 Tax=Marinomonas sp. MED121 TaxID=314277 RepID=UPI00006909EF|nr:DUF1428 domain-containing protein [Marinomonas sp. MED121]EAQ64033.1 hypothetical protein MED121_20726 [Marinomonas sp. MED121]
MNFIDGFVAAVPTENKAKYIEHAKEAALLFKGYGALGVVECWGEDVPEGEKTSFPMAVKCEEHETVVFSWVTWPSKAVRDKGWEAMMQDEKMAAFEMPFDGSRLIYGGFQTIVNE